MSFKKQLYFEMIHKFSQAYLEALSTGNADLEEVAEDTLRKLGAWESFQARMGTYLEDLSTKTERVNWMTGATREGIFTSTFKGRPCPCCTYARKAHRGKTDHGKHKTLRTHRVGR